MAHGFANPRQLVGVLTVHTQKVLLHVIRTIERLEAHVAVKGFLLAMNVLVSGVQISPIRAVRAKRAGVTLTTDCWRRWSGQLCRRCTLSLKIE